MTTHLQSFLQSISGPLRYNCYTYLPIDWSWKTINKKSEKEMCERHKGYVYSSNKKKGELLGCNESCRCCKPSEDLMETKNSKKIVGIWRNDGSCIAEVVENSPRYGKLKQKRICIDGDNEICTPQDTDRMIPCTIPRTRYDQELKSETRQIHANNSTNQGIAQDLLAAISADPQLSMFLKALKMLGIDISLTKLDHLTIFAPTNAVFQKVMNTMPFLLAEKSSILSFLKRRILPKKIRIRDLGIEKKTRENTWEGEKIKIVRSKDKATAETTDDISMITVADIAARNGYLNIIDIVI